MDSTFLDYIHQKEDVLTTHRNQSAHLESQAYGDGCLYRATEYHSLALTCQKKCKGDYSYLREAVRLYVLAEHEADEAVDVDAVGALVWRASIRYDLAYALGAILRYRDAANAALRAADDYAALSHEDPLYRKDAGKCWYLIGKFHLAVRESHEVEHAVSKALLQYRKTDCDSYYGKRALADCNLLKGQALILRKQYEDAIKFVEKARTLYGEAKKHVKSKKARAAIEECTVDVLTAYLDANAQKTFLLPFKTISRLLTTYHSAYRAQNVSATDEMVWRRAALLAYRCQATNDYLFERNNKGMPHYQSAVKEASSLCEKYPQYPYLQLEYAECCLDLGALQAQSRDFAHAERSMKTALSLIQEVLADDTRAYHALLGTAYYDLGNLYAFRSEYALAANHLRQAIALHTADVRNGYPLAQISLAHSLAALGDVYQSIHKPQVAVSLYREALSHHEPFAEQYPEFHAQLMSYANVADD